jgi:tRNA threonylcarbamoyladenosine biosynthesis protein TsaE
MQNEYHYYAKNVTELQNKAVDFAKNAMIGDVFCLYGHLGAGKTSFAQGFINYFSPNNVIIQSPTFTIMQLYEFNSIKIAHFDLYRIELEIELEELGIDEIMQDHIVLVEWANNMRSFLPQKRQDIFIEIENDGRLLKWNEYK